MEGVVERIEIPRMFGSAQYAADYNEGKNAKGNCELGRVNAATVAGRGCGHVVIRVYETKPTNKHQPDLIHHPNRDPPEPMMCHANNAQPKYEERKSQSRMSGSEEYSWRKQVSNFCRDRRVMHTPTAYDEACLTEPTLRYDVMIACSRLAGLNSFYRICS